MSSHQHPYADPTADPSASAGAETGAGPADGLAALPAWLRSPVRSWGVTRSEESWISGALGGVAARYGLDPLLVRGAFAAVCLLSAGLALLAYAVAWTVLPGPDGRVVWAQLRRGDFSGAGMGVAATGGVGLVSLISGVGVTASVLSGGGLTGLAVLAATGLLVWWLLTRCWDPSAQRPSGRRRSTGRDGHPAAGSRASGAGSSLSSPSWYMDARRGSGQEESAPDEAGFRSSWIDPETGQWRDRPHSRDLRAAERIAELEREAAAERAPAGRRAVAARAERPALGALTQTAALVLAGGLCLAAMAASVVAGVSGLGMVLGPAGATIVGGAAAIVVLAPVLLLAALRGRRAGLVSGASVFAVGMVVAGVVANLSLVLI